MVELFQFKFTNELFSKYEITSALRLKLSIEEKIKEIEKEVCWCCDNKLEVNEDECNECKNGINSWQTLELLQSLVKKSERITSGGKCS